MGGSVAQYRGEVTSRPDSSFFGEARRLDRQHAEALPRRRLEYPEVAHLLHSLGAKRLQAADLGLEVIRLKIQVHAAGVVDELHLYMQARVRIVECGVAQALDAGQRTHGPPEGASPKPRRSGEIIRLTVDNEPSQATAVHV